MNSQPRATIVSCDRGSAAVEFALVFPPFVMFLVGILYVCLVVYSAASLRFAVEQAARCYSVNASQCGSASTAQTYAQNKYYGLSNPTFTASTPSCGHQVSATLTLALNAVFKSWNIPLSATSCFP
jgi:Flp pilus assembly protein TadG